MLPEPSPSNVSRLDDRRSDLFGAVRQVRAWSRATGTPRAVLLALATYANPDGSNARPTIDTLARDTGLSVSTVRRGLRSLEDTFREVECTHRGGGRAASTYAIRLSPPVGNPGDEPLFVLETGDRIRTAGVSPRPGTPVTVTPHPGHSDRLPIDTARNREGVASGDRCRRHATVTDPPPCRKCQQAREANEEARRLADRLAVAERRNQARRDAAVDRATRVPVDAASTYLEARRRITTGNRVQSGTVSDVPLDRKDPHHAD